jgi:hypothetical protein
MAKLWPSFFYVQLYRHWRPPCFSVSFVVDSCVKNPHTPSSERRERERERESSRKQIRGRFVSNYLRYGVFWRRFSKEHFLSDLFSLIFRQVGSISIRILGFCFTEFIFSRSSLRRFADLSGLDFVVFLCHSYGSASILACFFPRALIAMFFAFHVNSLVSQTCRSWDVFISSSRRSDLVTHSCS